MKSRDGLDSRHFSFRITGHVRLNTEFDILPVIRYLAKSLSIYPDIRPYVDGRILNFISCRISGIEPDIRPGIRKSGWITYTNGGILNLISGRISGIEPDICPGIRKSCRISNLVCRRWYMLSSQIFGYLDKYLLYTGYPAGYQI